MVTPSCTRQETLRFLVSTLPTGRLRGRYVALSAWSSGGSCLLERLVLAQAELTVIESQTGQWGPVDAEALLYLGELQAEIVYCKSMMRKGQI